MTSEPVRDTERPGIVHRWVIGPMREVVYALRDIRSLEMKEISERRMIAEIKQYGGDGFVLRATGRLLAMFLGFNVLVTIGQYVRDHRIGHELTPGRIISSFLFISFMSLAIGGVAYGTSIKRLKEKYPEEFEPAEPSSDEA